MPSSSSSSSNPCTQRDTASGGAIVEAVIRAGDNGTSPSGASEYWVDASGDRADGHLVWDSTPSDTYNSGEVGFVLIVSSDGSAIFTVGGGSALSVQGPAITSITMVQLEAARQGLSYELYFLNLSVEFYKGNEVVGPWGLPEICWPRVGPNASMVVEVPAQPGVDKVVVTGTVRLKAASSANNAPPSGADDLKGRILVFGS
jgi:hypothetical protein